MRSTARAAAVLLGLFGCTRAAETPPKVVPDPVRDAAVDSATSVEAGVTIPDGGVRAVVERSSVLSIVARAPTGDMSMSPNLFDIGTALPLVQRLPGGGLVVAAEHARARAEGPGPLEVELLGKGFESTFTRGIVQGFRGFRWVWSDASVAIVSDEEETSRTGPRATSYKVGPDGFKVHRSTAGFWSAVVREGSVLALERAVVEIPNSSMYPKGSGYEQNSFTLKPARVAVLSGKGAPPSLPAGLCARSMSAAPDGTLAVTVDKCKGGAGSWVGVLRFAPSSTQAKVEALSPREKGDGEHEDLVVHAASASEIYVGDHDRLHTWNGKTWSTTRPFEDAQHPTFMSLSRAPNGELWAVLGMSRLVKRSADGATWTDVDLPNAPTDPLDDERYESPTYETRAFVKVKEPANPIRDHAAGGLMAPRSVDATGDDVLVLATVENEAFVLSTKPRTPVARLPSIPVQRARMMKRLKTRAFTTKKNCDFFDTFVMFPEATTARELTAVLDEVAKGDAGSMPLRGGEATVDGQKRLVLFGTEEDTAAAAKRFAARGAQLMCGAPVVERLLP